MDKTIMITNMRKVRASAIPTGSGSNTPIDMFCTSQSMPGLQDANTWGFLNNDPDMEVGLTEVGASPGMNPLPFQMADTPALRAEMTEHMANGTKFDIKYVYDDKNYEEILTIIVHGCFILNPGSSETTEIESVPMMTVSFQPRGGGKLEDIMTTTSVARP